MGERHTSEDLLTKFQSFVETRLGLSFPKERRSDLERAIHESTQELGFENPESFLSWLSSAHLSRVQIQNIASHLTVGETYFFRDKNVFKILQEQILPELVRRRFTEKRLRIWSAACSTGEEAYSIAMVMSSILPDLKDWNITILGTDINPNSLQKASKGIFRQWSFRNPPPGIQESFFSKRGSGSWKIHDHIRKMVSFQPLNLAGDDYPSLVNNTNAMDIIFCKNVFMYFLPDIVEKVVQCFFRSMVEGGWLIVSPFEISHQVFSQFEQVKIDDSFFFRKTSLVQRGDFPQIPKSASERNKASSLESYLHLNGEEEPSLPENPFQHMNSAPDASSKHVPTTDGTSELKFTAGADSPQEVEAPLFPQALRLFKEGKYPDAKEKAVALIALEPENSLALSLLAKICADLGQLQDAMMWCMKATAIDRLNPALPYLCSMISQESGEFDGAKRFLKQALYLNQDFVIAYFALGNLAKKEGKMKEAERNFKTALSLLQKYSPEEILPESEGMTAGRLAEIISSMNLKKLK